MGQPGRVPVPGARGKATHSLAASVRGAPQAPPPLARAHSWYRDGSRGPAQHHRTDAGACDGLLTLPFEGTHPSLQSGKIAGDQAVCRRSPGRGVSPGMSGFLTGSVSGCFAGSAGLGQRGHAAPLGHGRHPGRRGREQGGLVSACTQRQRAGPGG